MRGTSLQSRGKKPISSLNRLLSNKLRDIQSEQLKKKLANFIADKMPDAPTGFASAFADHLLTDASASFIWPDSPDDATIEIPFTGDDLLPVIEQAVSDIQEGVREAIPKIVRDSAKKIIKSLKNDWPSQVEHDETNDFIFKSNLYERWGTAFSLMRMIYTIALEMGSGVAAKRRRSPPKRNPVLKHTLIHLHARACQVVLEIITLMENGLADGAMARWRTLHEITVVAALLTKHGEDLAIKYRMHDAVEAKRAMDRYCKHHEELGVAPPTKKEIEQTELAYKECLARFGNNFGSEYGWAAHHLELKKPRLPDLEAAVGKSAMQSDYRLASLNVHAGASGIGIRMGLLDGGPTALAGASNVGFVDPAQNAAYDLVHITTLLEDRTPRIDKLIEWQILSLLRDELIKELARADRDLMKSHRAQVRLERQARQRKATRTTQRKGAG